MRGRQKSAAVIEAALIGGMVLVWWLASISGFRFERLFPSPWRILVTATDLIRDGGIFSHLGYSLHEIFSGLGIGATAGLAAGIVLGASRTAGRIFEPVIAALAPVPKIIIYPIFIWFLGIGMASRVAMGAVSTFFPMVIYTASAVGQVRPIYLESSRLLGASRLQTLFKVYFPAMLPFLWIGLRLGTAISVVSILLAETKLSQKGLGFLVIEYYNHFQIVEMYSVLLLVFATAIGLNAVFAWLQDRIAALREK
ncbi:MAG TPA: ABC transporter permease [Candidatus Binatia bacterium]|jgi:ABC-type nitrate/sulfonate/bicarbonate transport system permease component